MRTPRDATLQPRVDPPQRSSPAEVRRRWPGAIEALEREEQTGRLTVGTQGTLWFESDVPSDPYVWAASNLHGFAWIPQTHYRPDMCGCGRGLTDHKRCLSCGKWPSKCMCKKEMTP